ncbi:hypothetical protein GCM10009759_42090 [Kitasatospora saccharophila]|uniref:Uncharacterized protein n=1 Tax=Kitasatospora saccharophila TaxID=407973 RepID=A0ABN2X4X9_9ACTN
MTGRNIGVPSPVAKPAGRGVRVKENPTRRALSRTDLRALAPVAKAAGSSDEERETSRGTNPPGRGADHTMVDAGYATDLSDRHPEPCGPCTTLPVRVVLA